MTTLIFVENVLGSGQAVKLVEDFGDYSVTRDLRPGENARLVVSPFKTVTIEEIPANLTTSSPSIKPTATGLHSPRAVERRC